MPLNFVAKAAIQIGLSAASIALQMARKIEGPRLDNLKFTGGDYGAPLERIWGMRRGEKPIFWAEDLREVKRRRKTKGGKFNEYTYYGTWAVAVAGHEVGAIRRIWFDTHLVYDMTGAGPVTPFDFGGSGGNISDYITIYLGTETQEPDPRMQATVEAEFGEGSCPAYRGTAYVVFKDVPLEKLGNRIPQVSVEVSSGETFPFDTVDVGHGGDLLAFSPDHSILLISTPVTGEYSAIDVAALGIMVQADVTGGLEDNSDAHGFLSDGTILMSRPAALDVIAIPFGSSSSVELDGLTQLGDITNVVGPNGDDHWLATVGKYYTVSGDPYDSGYILGNNSEDTVGQAVWFTQIFRDMDGAIWLVGRNANSSATKAVFFRILGDGGGPAVIEASGLPSFSGHAVAFHYADATTDHFVLGWAGNVYAIERLTGTQLANNTSPYASGVTLNAFRPIKPGAVTFYIGFGEYSSVDLSLVRQLDYGDWHGGGGQDAASVYDPINHALITEGSGSTWVWNYLDRVGTDGVLLSTIVADVAELVGVAEYDFTDLDQTVQGWSVTRGQASNMVEPLLDVYDSDIRPHDFLIEGIKRTGTSGGTLLTENFVAGEPRYTVKVRSSAELPDALIVNFADIDADQQPNATRSSRPLAATDARGEMVLDLTTLALDVDEARGLADRYFRRLWNERRDITLSLTAHDLKLEPGDLRVLTLDDEALTARLIKVAMRADDILATEWRYDSPALAVLGTGTGAAFDGRNESAISVALISKGFFIDAPYLSDSDAQTPPIIYILAAPYSDGAWPGATAYQSVDGEYSDEIGAVVSSSMATWGRAGSLPYTNPNIWDRGSSITVTLQVGTLTGCTEADIDTNPLRNLAAIGAPGRWEYVNFTTATLTGAKTYTVSGFKRGRRGTEWAAELHAANDYFVLMDMAQDVAMGLSEVGTNLSFKAITSGRSTAFAEDIEPFTGASLMPYAPCQLDAVKDSGSGDWALSWVRRTRVGGAWTSGTTIPLSETSEAYEVDIMDGATVIRTITGLSSETATWTAAQQTTDFGSGQSTVTFRVYQISDAVDRGFAAEATV